MKRYLAAVGLVLCLALSACNDGKEPVEQTSRLGEAAGLDEEAILLTVDGREIPAWRYLYWLGYICQRPTDRLLSRLTLHHGIEERQAKGIATLT